MSEYPPENDRVRRMSEQEILDLFDWLDFRDQIGHPLTMCTDFLNLVKMAFEKDDAPRAARKN